MPGREVGGCFLTFSQKASISSVQSPTARMCTLSMKSEGAEVIENGCLLEAPKHDVSSERKFEEEEGCDSYHSNAEMAGTWMKTYIPLRNWKGGAEKRRASTFPGRISAWKGQKRAWLFPALELTLTGDQAKLT